MILKYDELSTLRNNTNKRIGLFKGTFDLIHHDHVKLINMLKSYCDMLVVEIKSDADVQAKKGNSRPIINENDRAYIVDNLKSVDYVIIGDKKQMTQYIASIIGDKAYSQSDLNKIMRDGYLIELLRPNVIFTSDEKPVPEIITDFCNQLGVEIKILPMQTGMHTTDIINKCKNL